MRAEFEEILKDLPIPAPTPVYVKCESCRVPVLILFIEPHTLRLLCGSCFERMKSEK